MDNFAEQLVKKEETGAGRRKRAVLIVSGVVFVIAMALLAFLQLDKPLMAFMGMVFSAVGGYWTYFMVQNTYVEYEYTFTNGELEVAKIIAKKKRIELLSTDVRSFTAFGKYEDGLEETDDMTVVIASDNIASHEYYGDFQDEEYGKVRLVFVPDDRMMENIRKFLPAKIKQSLTSE
jgi:hypothetical protein